jgi:hypothetical protein
MQNPALGFPRAGLNAGEKLATAGAVAWGAVAGPARAGVALTLGGLRGLLTLGLFGLALAVLVHGSDLLALFVFSVLGSDSSAFHLC